MENPAPTYRVYHLGWQQHLAAFVFTAGASLFLFRSWRSLLTGSARDSTLGMLITAVVLLTAAICWAIHVFNTTVAFTSDAVEVRSLFRRRKLSLSAIRGRRERVIPIRNGSITYLKLDPGDGGLPTLDFRKDYTFDDAFFRWFNALPDLDAEDTKARMARSSTSLD